MECGVQNALLVLGEVFSSQRAVAAHILNSENLECANIVSDTSAVPVT